MAAGYDGSIRIDSRIDTKGFNTGLSGIIKSLKGLGGVLGLAFGAKALIDFGKAAIDLASDLEETQNVVDVTFKEMAESVNEFASTSLKQFGLSELSAKKYTSTMGAMLKSSGFGTKAAAEMSIEMAKLTADMASFYNLDTDTAFQKIRAGISGETEPLKQLGINLNVANLEAFALTQGITKSYNAMSQSEQVMLRYNYLLKASADSQGDFARNSETWANQTKLLTEKWRELMGLIGKALIEILLPVVKFLNNVLDILIGIAKQVGKIYSMITGKNAIVEVNDSIAGSAADAEEAEIDLGEGIKKAAKEAQKAIAPFDELNLLQDSLESGGGSGGVGLGDGLNTTGSIDTTLKTEQVDDGLNNTKRKAEEFYIWISDWWNRLKQLLSVPITVPSIIFQPIPNPIYNPNWGLTPPLIPSPSFPPIPNPVYNPNWGLVPPSIPVPDFPGLRSPIYEPNWGLIPPPVPEPIFPRLRVPIFEPVWGLEYPALQPLEIPALNMMEYEKSLERLISETAKAWDTVLETINKSAEQQNVGLRGAWDTREKSYQAHGENIGSISAATSKVLVANTNSGLSTLGQNTANTILGTQESWSAYGSNLGIIAGNTAKTLVENYNEGFKSTAANMGEFQKVQNNLAAQGGTGIVNASYETAKAMRHNYLEAFKSTANSFMSLMKMLGEDVKSIFRGDASFGAYARVIGASAVAAGTIALAAPAAIPFVLGGLKAIGAGALAKLAIPALATGAVIPPNSEFLAVLGDQKSGTNIETPERLLRQIMQEELANLAQQGTNESVDAILNIDGTTIARALIPKIDQELQRMGYKTIYRTT